jgi:hypothetical protein
MPKKSHHRPPSKYSESSKAAAHVLESIEQLRAIQREFGALIVADGPLGNGELFSDVIATLVDRDERLHAMEDRLKEFFDRLGTDAMILDPIYGSEA